MLLIMSVVRAAQVSYQRARKQVELSPLKMFEDEFLLKIRIQTEQESEILHR